MNTFTKLAVLCTAISSLGLVACQSTTANNMHERGMKHGEKHGHQQHKKSRMTKEQLEAMRNQIQQTCQAKIGQTVNLTLADGKTMQGTCDVKFKPSTKQDKKALFAEKDGDKKQHRIKYPKQMTEAERAEFEKARTERDQQRQNMHKQIQQACEGKIGQTVNFTLNDQTIQGSCHVGFKPLMQDKKSMLSKS